MQQYNVPKTVVIDFDGTICDFDYPGIGKIKPGAIDAIKKFQSLGFKIIISSCRTCKYHPEIFANKDGIMGKYSQGHLDMVVWLVDNDVPFDYIDDGTMGKPMGDYYIDDKGIRFNDNWKEIGEWIVKRESKHASTTN